MARQGTPIAPKKRALFLEALARYGNVSAAAITAGFSRDNAYDFRARDRTFASAWDDALQQAADVLESEARRRAADGWDEPVFYQGVEMGLVRKYSDTLLIFLLKGARPEKFRDNVKVEHSGNVDVAVAIQRLQTALAAVLPDDPDIGERFANKVLELEAAGVQ